MRIRNSVKACLDFTMLAVLAIIGWFFFSDWLFPYFDFLHFFVARALIMINLISGWITLVAVIRAKRMNLGDTKSVKSSRHKNERGSSEIV